MADVKTDRLIAGLPIEISAITGIIALVLAVIAGAGTALFEKAKPAHYVSTAVLLVDQPAAIAAAPDNGPLLKIQQLRYYYAGLVRTDAIAGPVATKLQLPVAVVASDLSAFVDPSSFILDITATTRSAALSQHLAQAATTELNSYITRQQDRLGLAVFNRVVFDEVTPPQAGAKVSVSTTKVAVAALVALVVVGSAYLIVADLLRRRW